MTETQPDTFYLGLTMAGAISAGAYTAGVLDVLFEALDAHNRRFALGERNGWQGEFATHPRHRVALRVISGTSAGGVSAGLAVAGLLGQRSEATDADASEITGGGDGTWQSPETAEYRYEYRYTLEPLHYAWVEALDLYRDGKGFLTTNDLEGGEVASVLNSQHIEEAAKTALANIVPNGRPYRFLTEELDLFLTTTNLQGVPYSVGFAETGDGGRHTHEMAQHSAVRHFRLNGHGTIAHTSPWLEKWGDDGIALPVEPSVKIDFEAAGTVWHKFKNASIATGAFPVGLAARVINGKASDFGVLPDFANAEHRTTGGAWPINMLPSPPGDGTLKRPMPRLSPPGEGPTPDAPVHYVAVDGGVANNEPFELARYTLRQQTSGDDPKPGDKFLASNPRNADDATCAVLMIDPFPEGPSFTPLEREEAARLAALIPAATKLVPALINQARFKPGELIEATDGNVYSRYLLSPSRREPGAERPTLLGAEAIASGAFGGFGGFFDRSFRAHDYMLGQRNGQSFLKRHFLISREHRPLKVGDLAQILDEDGKIDEARRGMVRVVDAGEAFYEREMPLPVWPRLTQSQLEPILKQAKTRVREVGAAVVGVSEFNRFRKIVLSSVWQGFGWIDGLGDAVAGALRRIVISELIARDQHEAFRELAPPDDVNLSHHLQRAVLARLANAGGKPLPLALSMEEHAAATERGELPRDLLHVLLTGQEEPPARANKVENLRAFLGHPKIAPLVWRAPLKGRADERYTLAILKPEWAWTHQIGAFGSRIKEAIFG